MNRSKTDRRKLRALARGLEGAVFNWTTKRARAKDIGRLERKRRQLLLEMLGAVPAKRADFDKPKPQIEVVKGNAKEAIEAALSRTEAAKPRIPILRRRKSPND